MSTYPQPDPVTSPVTDASTVVFGTETVSTNDPAQPGQPVDAFNNTTTFHSSEDTEMTFGHSGTYTAQTFPLYQSEVGAVTTDTEGTFSPGGLNGGVTSQSQVVASNSTSTHLTPNVNANYSTPPAYDGTTSGASASFAVVPGDESQVRGHSGSFGLSPTYGQSLVDGSQGDVFFGQFYNYSAASVVVANGGGSTYAVGDLITLTGGTSTVKTVLRVATLSTTAVATVTVVNAGNYTVEPTNPVAQGSTNGSGSGATFTVTWQNYVAPSVPFDTLSMTGGYQSGSAVATTSANPVSYAENSGFISFDNPTVQGEPLFVAQGFQGGDPTTGVAGSERITTNDLFATTQGILSAVVVAGGTGYALGDIVTVSGGTNSVPAQFRVTAVNAGVVTSVVPNLGGFYTVLPSNPASTTGGTGTGLTLTVTWSYSLAANSGLGQFQVPTAYAAGPTTDTLYGYPGETEGSFGSAPGQPSGVSWVYGATAATVSWAAATSTGTPVREYVVVGYKVLNASYIPTEFAPALTAPVATTPSAQVSGGTFTAGTYFYKVTAINALGESLPSNEVSQTVILNGTLTVGWAAVTGATGYKIYRGTSTGAENKQFSVGAVTSFIDTGTAGASVSPPGANTTGTAYVAGQLVNFQEVVYQAKANFTSATTFSAANWNSWDQFERYEPVITKHAGGAATSVYVEHLIPGDFYFFRVYARNDVGFGVLSPCAKAPTSPATPGYVMGAGMSSAVNTELAELTYISTIQTADRL